MKCFTCKTEMVCYDYVNHIEARIDLVECPKCGSKADIVYDDDEVSQIQWRRGQVNK